MAAGNEALTAQLIDLIRHKPVNDSARHSAALFVLDAVANCPFARRLEQGRFVWPQATHEPVHLSAARLSILLEGIDWRRVSARTQHKRP